MDQIDESNVQATPTSSTKRRRELPHEDISAMAGPSDSDSMAVERLISSLPRSHHLAPRAQILSQANERFPLVEDAEVDSYEDIVDEVPIDFLRAGPKRFKLAHLWVVGEDGFWSLENPIHFSSRQLSPASVEISNGIPVLRLAGSSSSTVVTTIQGVFFYFKQVYPALIEHRSTQTTALTCSRSGSLTATRHPHSSRWGHATGLKYFSAIKQCTCGLWASGSNDDWAILLDGGDHNTRCVLLFQASVSCANWT